MTSLIAEPIFFIKNIPVTNTVINTVLVDCVLIGTAIDAKNHIKKIPGFFQNCIEYVIESLYDLTESVAGKNTQQIFPFFITFFLFIIVANWSGLIPGNGSIGFFQKNAAGQNELIPLFRNATSDLNVTLALAVVSLVATHILSVKSIGIKEYLLRFFPLSPLIFIGVLELFSELVKIVSLSFRLFGNIYAGEVLLNTASSIFVFFIPIPFMLLELLVGFVQALVFSLLTMAFMSILMTPHASDAH